MMWHTDFKQLADGRRFVGYEDGASRRLPSHGVFDGAATANAPAVPHAAMAKHGRPAPAMADHGSQFFANEAEGRRRVEAAFEAEPKRLLLPLLPSSSSSPPPARPLRRQGAEPGRTTTPCRMQKSACRPRPRSRPVRHCRREKPAPARGKETAAWRRHFRCRRRGAAACGPRRGRRVAEGGMLGVNQCRKRHPAGGYATSGPRPRQVISGAACAGR